jgi:transforming growth factor-beta-induced protein
VTAKEVMGMTSNKSVNGMEFKVKVDGDTVKINDSTVVKTDIEASNGIIHAIDTLLTPPESK